MTVRLTISVPDDLAADLKAADFNVSAICQQALSMALDRRRRLAALMDLLVAWEAEYGPVTAEEMAEAHRMFDRAEGKDGSPWPSRRGRTSCGASAP